MREQVRRSGRVWVGMWITSSASVMLSSVTGKTRAYSYVTRRSSEGRVEREIVVGRAWSGFGFVAVVDGSERLRDCSAFGGFGTFAFARV